MIDIGLANKAFDEYVQKYNPEDKKILLKINHIKRVEAISRELAINLKLSEEDILLAQLIGLLHDIGRFEQIRIYNTFKDKDSVNHGELGAKILFEDGLIRNFIEDTQYDNIIKKAVINHNRNNIEDGLNSRESLHSKIIRDSDKTDIFYVTLTEDVKTCYETDDMSKEIISDEIYREFIEDNRINYQNRKSSADIVVCHLAFVFDFNFNYGLEILQKKEYIDKLYNRFSFKDVKTQKKFDKIYNYAKEYISKQLAK